MTRKTKQAIKKQELHANREANVRFLLRVTYVILALSLLLWGWSLLGSSNFFPVKEVIVKGQYNEIDPKTIKVILQPYLNTGLLQLKTGTLRQEFQDLPWVKTAEIDRDWPNTLVVVLTQKIPVARWHKNALVTADGEVFFPAANTISTELPELSSSANLIAECVSLLEQIKSQVVSINLTIKKINLTERQAVSLVLAGRSTAVQVNFTLLLGQENIQERLDRFISIYPKVFANRLDQVEYVDMRYTNGMAVKWKQTQ